MYPHTNALHLIKKRWKIISLFGLLGAMITVVGTLVLPIPLEYRADAQILIVSQSRYGVDPYTAAKSAERIGENLAQIVETSDFFNKVFAISNVALDRSPYDGVTEQIRRKRWAHNVEAQVTFGTSVLTVSSYNKDPKEALRLTAAITQTIISNSADYVGSDAQMRIINQPVASQYPVRPNIQLLALIGVALGVCIGGLLVMKK